MEFCLQNQHVHRMLNMALPNHCEHPFFLVSRSNDQMRQLIGEQAMTRLPPALTAFYKIPITMVCSPMSYWDRLSSNSALGDVPLLSAGHRGVFRSNRPPIPGEGGHLIRSKAAERSGGIRPLFLANPWYPCLAANPGQPGPYPRQIISWPPRLSLRGQGWFDILSTHFTGYQG